VKDIYVLQFDHKHGGALIFAADDIERVNMKLADFTAGEQEHMQIRNIDLHEDGD
jgi:hypothetical protein